VDVTIRLPGDATAAFCADMQQAGFRLRSLDLGYIRSTLNTLEQALAQADLLPALETELVHAQRSRSS
jgi:hypothetical protein